jgi:hypothetical protein
LKIKTAAGREVERQRFDIPSPPPTAKNPTLEGVRATYSARLVTNIKRVPEEILEASLAANRLHIPRPL